MFLEKSICENAGPFDRFENHHFGRGYAKRSQLDFLNKSVKYRIEGAIFFIFDADNGL